MKHKILTLLLITSLILIIIAGCRREPVKTDSRHHESLSHPDPTQKKLEKPPEIIGRDRHYLQYANGVVYDEKTGLEWYAGPDQDTDFDQARSWVENLTVAGGRWRMPTKYELRTLYKEVAGTSNMTPLLTTTGMWVWAGEVKDSSAWTFNFEYGYGHWDFRSNSNYFRAFAVRFR